MGYWHANSDPSLSLMSLWWWCIPWLSPWLSTMLLVSHDDPHYIIVISHSSISLSSQSPLNPHDPQPSQKALRCQSGAFVGMELGSRACMFLPVGSTSGGSVGPLMILPWPFLFPEPMITIIIRVCSNHLRYAFFFPMIFCCVSALSEVIHDTLQKHRKRSTDWSTGNQGFNPHTPVIEHRHSYGTSGAFMDNLPIDYSYQKCRCSINHGGFPLH